MNTLSELVNLLTNHALEADELEDIVEQVSNAPNDPYYEWAQGDADIAIGCELVASLDEFAATSDKLDELHEQIQDMFDDDFPGFPYELVGGEKGVMPYFDWLDAELVQRGTDEGRYAALCLDTGADDRESVFLVYLEDRERALTLGRELGLKLRLPQDVYGGA